MSQIVRIIIRFYQIVGRAIFPGACRFYPSCSQYALDAIEKYGLGKGGMKAVARVARCSPLSGGGYDPVK
jgi:putative membrane protein insertion efficiency factor